MPREPQNGSPAFRWGDYVADLAERHGSLAALAVKLALVDRAAPDAATVERALRRLRTKEHEDGGHYGQLLLRTFGMPRAIEERAKWMGVYHSRFTDLPVSLCLEQLQLWDRPPLAESRTRTWLALGFATCALRQHDSVHAREHLNRARGGHGSGTDAMIAARIEVQLLEAFLASQEGDSATAIALLEAMEPMLNDDALAQDERACLVARWVDQRAYQVLHPKTGSADFVRAEQLYRRIAGRRSGGDNAQELPFFAACKRDSGLAYVCFRTGRHEEALRYAEQATAHAGDGGFARLRAAALGLWAHILGVPAGDEIRARALRVAKNLEDDDLVHRLRHAQRDAEEQTDD